MVDHPITVSAGQRGQDGWEPIGYTEDGEAAQLCPSKKKPIVGCGWWRRNFARLAPRLFPMSPPEATPSTDCGVGARDIKAHAGLSHCPSANAAWLACTVLAHNLTDGEHHTSPVGQLTNGNTVRTRLFRLPGRIVNHGGKLILRLPARWPWADTYLTTLGIRRANPPRLHQNRPIIPPQVPLAPTHSRSDQTPPPDPANLATTPRSGQKPPAPLPRIPNHPHHPPTQIKTVDSSLVDV